MIDEALLHKAFLAALPTCLTLEGWINRNEKVWSVDQRVRLAWDIAIAACEMHPTRPAESAALSKTA